MKHRILFVDDEVNILRGIKRMLRGMKDEWDMAFAENGKKALEMISKVPIDVVVSDMRMPGMDGAQLLNEVRKLHPGTARIILSGYSDKESILRTVGPAHQYLAKPCDGKLLIKTITSALELRKLLKKDNLRSIVSGLEALPTPLQVLSELLEELNSPKASASSVAEILSQDIAMTAQILKLTNSSFFAIPMGVTTAQHAVQLLGMETIRALVLMVGFFTTFEGGEKENPLLDTLSLRSASIGGLAMAITEEGKLEKAIANQACCAGMVSHVGTLLLSAKWPEKFRQAMLLSDAEDIGIVEAEKRIIGTSHAEIGAYLLGLWGFTDPIVEAVAYHHTPSKSVWRKRGPLMALHVAQHLTKSDGNIDDVNNNPGIGLDRQYLEELGVMDCLPVWQNIYHKFKERKLAK